MLRVTTMIAKLMVNSNPSLIVASLDNILPDNYLCLVESIQQQIKEIRSRNQTTKEQYPSWPTGREVMTTSSCWVRGYNSTPSPTVQSTPVNRTAERDSAVSGY